MLLLTWTWRRTDSTERTFLVLQSDVPAGAAGFLHLKSRNDRAGCRDALLLNSNDHTRGSSGSVIWNVLLDYLGAGLREKQMQGWWIQGRSRHDDVPRGFWCLRIRTFHWCWFEGGFYWPDRCCYLCRPLATQLLLSKLFLFRGEVLVTL